MRRPTLDEVRLRSASPHAVGAGLVGLLGALLGCLLAGACSASEAPGARTETRLERAPLPAEFPGLDPAAVAAIRKAAEELESHPDQPERWTQLGIVLQAHLQLELARTCYAQRLLRGEDDAHTWYDLGLIDEDRGETERALAEYARCRALEPRYVPAHWRIGFLRLARGELAAAREAFEGALAIAPEDAAATVGLARVELQESDFAGAARRLEAHLARVPRDGNARYLLGTAYRGAGRTQEAERTLAAGAGGEPLRNDPWEAEMLAFRQGYRTEFLQALEALAKGDLETSLATLEALHTRRPEDTLIHVNLQRAYRKKGELTRAIELLLEARRLDPLLDVVHLHLAGAYRDLARRAGGEPDRAALEEALESAERACALSPTFGDAQGMRADVLTDLGRRDEALEGYVRAAELAQDSTRWNEKAGLGLCQAGRWAEAVPFLTRLDALTPGTPRTLLTLSAALANSGRLEEARRPLLEARRLAPEDPAIQRALEDLERGRARTSAGGGG